MNDQKPVIMLMVAEPPIPDMPKDRAGGETHSEGILKRIFGHEKPVDIDKMKRNLDQCLDQVGSLLSNIREKALEDWSLENVSISLAVSAEGSIGVATAGVEASIEVTFKPKG